METLEEEIDKLSERVESLQRDNQFKDDVSPEPFGSILI